VKAAGVILAVAAALALQTTLARFIVRGTVAVDLVLVVVVCLALTMGPTTGLFAGALGLSIKRFGGWAISAAPVIWATSEWLRLQSTGMGWNPLGLARFQPFSGPFLKIDPPPEQF
jgi:apolipoprotein N-acyltransferase